MIIKGIANSILFLMQNLMQFSIAPLEGLESITIYFEYIVNNGIALFRFIFPPASRVILTVIIGAHVAVELYYIVMWIVKKLPMLNIH